jgi:hypothetical protein
MSKNAEIIGLRDLKPDSQNARRHRTRNVAMGRCLAGSEG